MSWLNPLTSDVAGKGNKIILPGSRGLSDNHLINQEQSLMYSTFLSLTNFQNRHVLLLLTNLIIALNSGLLQAQTDKSDSPEIQVGINIPNSTPLYHAIDLSILTPVFDQHGQSEPTEFGMNLRVHTSPYMTETVETILNPRNEVEFMVHIEEGEVLLYTWETDEPLYYDLHGHQREGDPDVWTRYIDGEANRDQGSIVIPYSGDHGWYWVNLGSKPVKIRLTIAGYYKEIFKIDLSAQQD